MAKVNAKEKAEMLRIIIDAYGIGVRGGVITPNIDDENEFRKMMGLKPANRLVIAEWQRTKGVRLPITLQRSLSEGDAPQSTQTEGNSNEQN